LQSNKVSKTSFQDYQKWLKNKKTRSKNNTALVAPTLPCMNLPFNTQFSIPLVNTPYYPVIEEKMDESVCMSAIEDLAWENSFLNSNV